MLSAALLFGLIALPAQGTTPAMLAKTNEKILARVAAKLAADCRASGGRPGDMRKAIVAADVTGDGLVDWMIDDGNYRCPGSNDAMSGGNGGVDVDIYAGQADGSAKLVFREMVFGVRFDRVGTRHEAVVRVGGSYCGQKGEFSRGTAWGCELPLLWKGGALRMAPPSIARDLRKP